MMDDFALNPKLQSLRSHIDVLFTRLVYRIFPEALMGFLGTYGYILSIFGIIFLGLAILLSLFVIIPASYWLFPPFHQTVALPCSDGYLRCWSLFWCRLPT